MWRWVVMALVGVLVGGFFLRPDRNLHVIACDIGQGDAILITHGTQQVLVDGGPNDSVLSCLSRYIPFWDREIEVVVLTNGDADHVTGLIDVLERYEVGKLVANNLIQETARFAAFRETVASQDVEVYAPEAGDVIRVGPSTGSGSTLRFNVLWPEDRLGQATIWQDTPSEVVLGANTYSKTTANEQSVVMKLEYGDFDVLLTGDIGFPTEEAMVEASRLEDVELLKVGHHGSRYSSSEAFLEALSPELAVISVGKKNTYGHPTVEAIDRLKASGAKVLTTKDEGSIEVVSDGARWWVAD